MRVFPEILYPSTWPMRPRVGIITNPWHIIDFRLSPRSLYIQILAFYFSWTFMPARDLDLLENDE